MLRACLCAASGHILPLMELPPRYGVIDAELY
jgi:hypothetical protein